MDDDETDKAKGDDQQDDEEENKHIVSTHTKKKKRARHNGASLDTIISPFLFWPSTKGGPCLSWRNKTNSQTHTHNISFLYVLLRAL